ncbi:hypothetical protein GCM10023187_52850 [Nibrella viscosa]|uniref:Uncharacterized protein n=1 Tax=Nibrella viscosa TaxID=1084524 RepID=A0ABP8KY10_9BACT
MADQGLNQSCGLGIPEFQGAIVASGEQPPTIGAKGDGENDTIMARKCSEHGSCLSVPKFEGIIVAARQQSRAVRTKGY